MWKRPPLAEKMGQKVSQEDNQENKADTLVICEVFSQGEAPCISKAAGLSQFCGSSKQIPASHKQAERDLPGQLHWLLRGKGCGGADHD